MKGIRVDEFYYTMREKLQLKLVAGEKGLKHRIKVAEINRPGLALADHFDFFGIHRMQLLGKIEITYLRSMESGVRRTRIKKLLRQKIPCIIVTRRYIPPLELLEEADRLQIPVFRSSLITMQLLNQMTLFLEDLFAPTGSVNGTLVEAFGVGVMIVGKSGVGKSECALSLIEKGHRLIADDIVKIKKEEGKSLQGMSNEIARYHMEIRGIGIIDIQTLFGASCVRERKRIDLVISLEEWDSKTEYDRLGLVEHTYTILGVDLPHLVIPVRSGRDIALLVEVAALNYRLKAMGHHPAESLDRNVIAAMKKKKKPLTIRRGKGRK